MKQLLMSAVLLFTAPQLAHAHGQVAAGSAEDKLFQQLRAERNSEAKARMLTEFENKFPQSKLLVSVYLMAIDVYREKNDRAQIIHYAEKALKLDEGNITVMMVLARNYAIEMQNLDHAVALAQRAVDQMETLKRNPAPRNQSAADWAAYLASSESAARDILAYALTIRGQTADKPTDPPQAAVQDASPPTASTGIQ